jgi:putative transcriptional regulator
MDEVRARLAHKIAGEITLSDDAGKTIRKWREIFKVSQKELADELKVNPSVISDYESGRRSSPGIKMVKKLVDALLNLDSKKGGENTLKMGSSLSEAPLDVIIDIREFNKPVDAKKLVKAVDGEVVCCEEYLNKHVFGYTVVDSLKAIVEFSPLELTRVYGSTTERALIFTNVSTGKSPMIAIKLTSFKPTMVVFHGLDKPHPLAVKLAERERIPLIVSKSPSVEVMIDKLRNSLNA